MSTTNTKFVDIGANLLDERFTLGEYRGKLRHLPDFHQVVERANHVGVRHIVITAGTLKESKQAVKRVRELRQGNTANVQFYCTVGVHPTRCNEFLQKNPDQHLQELLEVAIDGSRDGTVASVGEMGLDYDRLQFCSKETQKTYFERQLVLSKETNLPLFLHNRNVGTDVYDVLAANGDKWSKAVIHSFDDSLELATKFIDLSHDVYIGLNGCSLRKAENLEVARQLPLDRILLETDCPYCDVKRTHAGYKYVTTQFDTIAEKKCNPDELPGCCVKGRNEPCQIVQIAEVVAGAKGISVEELAKACYANSLRLYGWNE
jgi:TatD DNase family protein